jgi:hypothetical protein
LAVLDGGVVAVVAGVYVVLSTVVFADPRAGGSTGVALLEPALLAVMCAVIGAHVGRGASARWIGLLGGALGGVVIFVGLAVAVLIVDNVWYEQVRQQPEKIAAFAGHAGSMRAWINASLLRGAAIGTPVVAVVGGLCGLLGAGIARQAGKRTAAEE